MTTPYYQDEQVTLYHGTIADILPMIKTEIDLIMADPPYAETSLAWDRWPDGWPSLLDGYGASMWCFGSMAMFLDRRDEFTGWRRSQEVVWEKHNGSGFAADRFKRVHEFAVHWYRGSWADVYHEVPRVPGGAGNKNVRTRGRTPHTGTIGTGAYEDDGLRLTRSVIYATSRQGKAINPTEKPPGILRPLIQYGCPPGGTVLDLFAGSCSASVEARALGMNSIAIEAREEQCETAALSLSAGVLDLF